MAGVNLLLIQQEPPSLTPLLLPLALIMVCQWSRPQPPLRLPLISCSFTKQQRERKKNPKNFSVSTLLTSTENEVDLCFVFADLVEITFALRDSFKLNGLWKTSRSCPSGFTSCWFGRIQRDSCREKKRLDGKEECV